jgi:hypothetical protein
MRCSICREVTADSAEHIPPEKAFNSGLWIAPSSSEGFGPIFNKTHGRHFQNGYKKKTLCEPCNKFTGHEYVPAYIEFARVAAKILEKAQGEPQLGYSYRITPLKVIKQTITMFASVTEGDLVDRFPEVKTFILNTTESGLNPRIKILLGYNPSIFSRSGGFIIRGDVRRIGHSYVAEVSHFPFTWILEIGDIPVDETLFDISGLASYSNNAISDVFIQAPVRMPIAGPIGNLHDFSGAEAIRSNTWEAYRNQRLGGEWIPPDVREFHMRESMRRLGFDV